MRHQKTGRRLSRTWSHRKAMFRNMVTSLFEQEQIVTTEAKAKELRRVADRMITLGKRGTLHARRQALAYIRGPQTVKKIFEELAPRFQERPGGYTRIVKLPPRKGDNAALAMIELVERVEKSKAEKGGKAAGDKKEKGGKKKEKLTEKKGKGPKPQVKGK